MIPSEETYGKKIRVREWPLGEGIIYLGMVQDPEDNDPFGLGEIIIGRWDSSGVIAMFPVSDYPEWELASDPSCAANEKKLAALTEKLDQLESLLNEASASLHDYITAHMREMGLAVTQCKSFLKETT